MGQRGPCTNLRAVRLFVSPEWRECRADHSLLMQSRLIDLSLCFPVLNYQLWTRSVRSPCHLQVETRWSSWRPVAAWKESWLGGIAQRCLRYTEASSGAEGPATVWRLYASSWRLYEERDPQLAGWNHPGRVVRQTPVQGLARLTWLQVSELPTDSRLLVDLSREQWGHQRRAHTSTQCWWLVTLWARVKLGWAPVLDLIRKSLGSLRVGTEYFIDSRRCN